MENVEEKIRNMTDEELQGILKSIKVDELLAQVNDTKTILRIKKLYIEMIREVNNGYSKSR